MKKLGVAAIVALFLLPQLAHAQDATNESVRRYMELTNADRGLNQIGAAVFQRVVGQLRTQNPAITDETLRKVGESIKAVMVQNAETYRELVATALQSVLTEEEVLAANEFYSSPLGQSFAAKVPKFSQVGANASREWVAGMQSDLELAVQQALNQ